MRRASILLALLACGLAVTARADETEEYNKIRGLLSENKFEEAEKLYETALQEYPDSSRLESMAYLFYLYANRDEKHDVALKYVQRHVDRLLQQTSDNPRLAASLSSYVNVLLEAYQKAGKADEAPAKLDAIVSTVNRIADGGVDAALAARDLRNKQVTLLAESGKADEARKLLEARSAAAGKAVEEKPDSAAAQLDRVYVLKAESELEAATDGAQAEAARDKFLAALLEAAKAHKDDAALAAAAIDNYVSAASGLSRKDPYAAEKLLTAIKEFAGTVKSEDAALTNRLSTLERSAASLESAIAAGKVHADLIGKDAFPLAAEAWINGDPLTAEDLQGKVVLLDFWAVWCGPCIATFPHLREWREKYADKGLVIIGVTRYYEYGWDEEAKRPQRVAGISKEDEQQAMLKFAEHHELEHRFMITPSDSKLQEAYGVTGIPQAVLIDREGKIRLIRVGSGDANAHDIDHLLTQLIEDRAAGE
jgi:thiol-disulfide isomerase/thioredoxin